MADSHFVSRVSSLWLIAALFMVLLPIWNQLPFIIIALGVLAILWRLLILIGRGRWPPGWLRVILVLLSLFSVVVSFKPLVSLESTVAVLAAGYSLKLLELRTRRDALVVVYIGFFLIASSVLFSQTLLHTLYLACCLVALIAAQQGLYQHSRIKLFKSTLQFAGILAIQALPVTILLFVLVPRVGPLWSVPLPDHSAKTGLSDEMTPGEIARLSRSDELVFRAQFKGDIPTPEDRYWRAIVFDRFDGKTWRQTNLETFLWLGAAPEALVSKDPASSEWWPEHNGGYQYEIMMEPTGKPWLYSLGYPLKAPENSSIVRTLRVEADKSVYERRVYGLNSSISVPDGMTEPEWMRQYNLKLPTVGNRKSRTLAAELIKQANYDTIEFAKLLMSRFREESFAYTLNPPLATGADSIDQFLFNNKAGFCAHYAGAFVYLMRSAGIPARVVAGYQGGELKEGGLIQVRQFDAHAWSEVWVEGVGWYRFDPTSAVAPERVAAGLEEALTREAFLPDSPFSLYRYRNTSYLNKLRLSYERLEYQWQRSVVAYSKERQQLFLSQILGEKDLILKQGGAMALGFLAIMAALSFFLLFRKKRLAPLVVLYGRFERKMKRKGFTRAVDEGEQTFAMRVAESDAEMGEAAMLFTGEYIKQAYQRGRERSFQELKRLLRRF